MTRSNPAIPTLSAVQVDDPSGSPRLAAWCPWCEALHYHGGSAGLRSAHCEKRTGSPLPGTGYRLDIVRSASRAGEAIPPGPLVGLYTLRAALDVCKNRLQAALAAALIGAPRAAPVLSRRIPRRGVHVTVFGSRWALGSGKGAPHSHEGRDLVSLAAEAFGVPHGVAAVRILEDVTGLQLDAKAALGVQAVIDDYQARGAPRGEGRR